MQQGPDCGRFTRYIGIWLNKRWIFSIYFDQNILIKIYIYSTYILCLNVSICSFDSALNVSWVTQVMQDYLLQVGVCPIVYSCIKWGYHLLCIPQLQYINQCLKPVKSFTWLHLLNFKCSHAYICLTLNVVMPTFNFCFMQHKASLSLFFYTQSSFYVSLQSESCKSWKVTCQILVKLFIVNILWINLFAVIDFVNLIHTI